MKRIKYVIGLMLLLTGPNLAAGPVEDSLQKITDSLHAIRFHDTTTVIGKLDAYENITIHLFRNGKYDTCRQVCKDAIRYAHSVNNPLYESSFNTRIGTTYFYEGEFAKTASYWTQALKVSESGNVDRMTGQVLNNLAVLFMHTEMYEESLDYFTRSLEFKMANKDYKPFSIAITKMNIATLLNKLQKSDSAYLLLKSTKPVFEKNKEKHPDALAMYYINIGGILVKIDRFDEALQANLRAEKMKEHIYRHNLITLYYNIGENYLMQKEFTKGLDYIDKSLKMATDLEDKRALRNIYRILGTYYYNINDYQKAYEYQELHQILKDSLFDTDKTRQINIIKALYEVEKKDQENKLLSEQVKNQEFLTQRQIRINRTLLAFSALILITAIVVTILWRKVRSYNHQLVHQKEKLEKLNHEISRSKEETEKALEFKSQFLANMSHEIRTPLNIIIGFNSILKKRIEDPKFKKYIHSIEVSSYNLLQFLNDILDMSKIEAGKMMLSPGNISIRSMIYDLRDLFLMKAEEKDLKIEVNLDRTIPEKLFIDEVRLRQILVNLIGNAIKFTEKGSVKIFARCDQQKNRISQLTNKTTLIISIIDTGIGIEKNDLQAIFDSFKQVNHRNHTQFGGSGLGLAISKRLTEMMDGELTVESEPGKGSTFTVTFREIPIGIALDEDTKKAPDVSEFSDIEFKEGTILIADDEEMNRSLVTACFDKTPVKVLEAKNGDEAYDLAKQNLPNLILMDLKMPFTDGFEASRKIKQDDQIKATPIFAFTASTVYSDLDEAKMALFEGFISKPVYVFELFEEASRFLPHKEKEKTDNKVPDQRALLQIEKDCKLIEEDSVKFLTGEMMKKWQTAWDSNSMTKIRNFSDSLETYSRDKNITSLLMLSGQLHQAVKTFDTDKAKAHLKRFPEIVELLKVKTTN